MTTYEKVIQIGEKCKSRNKDIPLCDDWETRKYCDRKLCCALCPEFDMCNIKCEELEKFN